MATSPTDAADASASPVLPARPSASSSSLNKPNSSRASDLRNRLSRKSSNLRSPEPALLRRRSSILSYSSLEDARNSFHDDVIHPTSSARGHGREDEITHWSSTPLAFAILPAIAGLLFTNGSAFVTDALLLGLAAVFMNWSIRVPREWYHSAQAVRLDLEVEPLSSSAVLETDESNVDESDGSPKSKSSPPPPKRREEQYDISAREQASDQLQRQEIFALGATFVFPAVAAYLLHVIRSQLSRPSTTLVSDYNLSIFLLAAEFWPARQVIRLVAARTLHLQRTVSGFDDPFADTLAKSGRDNTHLLARIEEIETKLAGQALVPATAPLLHPSDLANLDTQIQKRLEPRLDSLERAVRRYEKRYTTLAMLTEQRLQTLETRLQDALALAAVAAQHSQQRNNALTAVAGAAGSLVSLPFKIGWELATWPFKILDDVFVTVKSMLLGPVPGSSQAGKRKPRARQENIAKDEKLLRDKLARKSVR